MREYPEEGHTMTHHGPFCVVCGACSKCVPISDSCPDSEGGLLRHIWNRTQQEKTDGDDD